MAAMGRDVAVHDPAGTGRRKLPNEPRSKKAAAEPPQDLSDAMTNVRALDLKLRGQLKKDRERMNMSSRDKSSDSTPSTASPGERKPLEPNRVKPTATCKFTHVCLYANASNGEVFGPLIDSLASNRRSKRLIGASRPRAGQPRRTCARDLGAVHPEICQFLLAGTAIPLFQRQRRTACGWCSARLSGMLIRRRGYFWALAIVGRFIRLVSFSPPSPRCLTKVLYCKLPLVRHRKGKV